jgi:hypothetical protein
MPILKKAHVYHNRNPKKSPYINEIIPQDDREVSKRLFDSFEDITEKGREDGSANV